MGGEQFAHGIQAASSGMHGRMEQSKTTKTILVKNVFKSIISLFVEAQTVTPRAITAGKQPVFSSLFPCYKED